MLPIDLMEQFQVLLLHLACQMRGRLEIENPWLLGPEHRTLKQRWHKTIGPIRHPIDRMSAGIA